MGRTFTSILLLLLWPASLGKYVYNDVRMTWPQAQRFCRRFHTDLAPVSDQHDMWQLQLSVRDPYDFTWIGLRRNSTDPDKWTWSGGAGVSRFFWAPGQPGNQAHENYGVTIYQGWHDARSEHLIPALCYRVVVVRERRTWEEALHYCEEHHRQLASVASETEMLLIKKELDEDGTTDHVWMGLHFLAGEWLWVDGRPMSYEAWGPDGRPACPDVRWECGAIEVTRGNPPAVAGPTPLHHASPGDGVIGEIEAPGVNEQVWKNRGCEERFHFLCY